MNEAPNHALISPLRLSGKRFLKDFFAMVLMDDLPTSILSNSATKGLPLFMVASLPNLPANEEKFGGR